MVAKKYRLNDLADIIAPIVPSVQHPERKLPLRERVGWTILCLLLYLVLSQVPLYGIGADLGGTDPLYWVRMIVASNKGSLMELGLTPIMTAGMVMMLLAGARFVDHDSSRQAHRQYALLQKVLGIVFTFGEGLIYVVSGMYGDVSKLGSFKAFLVIMQLTGSGVVLTMMDEILQNGYGIGENGINLFISANICERIIWKAFSPTWISTANGMQFEGAVVALFHLILTRPNKFSAIKEAMVRSSGPNLTNLSATVIVFLLVIYLQGFRVDLAVKSTRVRGQSGTYPIKLFYTSSMPIILQTALVSNIYFFSQFLHTRFPGNAIVRLVGKWATVEQLGGQTIPIGGIAYYISPPLSVAHVFKDPLHTILYALFVLATCAMFSRVWINVSGNASADVAKNLRAQGVGVRGHRDSNLVAVLDRYIPAAAAFGGIAVGFLTILADFLGAVGSGTGILLAVSIIYGYHETFAKEKMSLEMR